MYKVKKKKRERIILVGVRFPDRQWEEVEDSLEELKLLSQTAGGKVVGKITQSRQKPDYKTFIGSGKVKELKKLCNQKKCKTIVFDDDLKPSQALNLTRETGRKIIDRSGLILDIFSRRAKTREAKIQVELAQLEYLLPRLTGRWKHLSRQQGGIGTRGPGEKQIEMDKRQIQKRISKLKDRLKKIEKQRKTRRSRRSNVRRAAIVGYTNAGKSTFLNQIADADVFIEDKLFATLDSTTRVVRNQWGYKVLFTDTVGFIRKLPHNLIESFKSTLAEAKECDILLHIVDITDKNREENIEVVNKILRELDIHGKPKLLLFNKTDILDGDLREEDYTSRYSNACFISAKFDQGIKKVKSQIFHTLFDDPQVPHWQEKS